MFFATKILELYGLVGSLVFFGVIFIAAMILLFVLYKTKSALNIAVGPLKFNLGSKKESNILSKDKLNILVGYIEDFQKRMSLSDNELLKRQMNVAEQKISQIKFLLVSSYVDHLSKKIEADEDPRNHKDYRNFQILTSMMLKEIAEKIFKTAFLDNHIVEMEGATWDNYLRDKSIYVLNFIGEFLDVMYGEGKILSRQDLAEIEKSRFEEIKQVVREILNSVREVTLQFASENGKLKKQYESDLLDSCIKSGILIEDDRKQREET